MKLIKVESLEVPGLEPYRTMRRPAEHRAQGLFVAEGEKVVRRLVASDLEIVSVLLTEEWLKVYSVLLESRNIEARVFVAEKELLERIVGYGLHQGIMAIGKVPAEIDLFQTLEKVEKPRLLVAVDGIANSENMGVLVRNCAAFGAQALIVGETSCDPYLRRAVRNSMGTVFQLRISGTESLQSTLKRLREQFSIGIVAAHPRNDSIN
ncbi:MAG TPA: TrmH family RNA methyltransferase, partial [Candidatus Kryptobacter bacterium]|nr:TrmH family RNA methyltransferase [Candidatus Kryptobacter bacterium]